VCRSTTSYVEPCEPELLNVTTTSSLDNQPPVSPILLPPHAAVEGLARRCRYRVGP
jgi:hypothetical protein